MEKTASRFYDPEEWELEEEAEAEPFETKRSEIRVKKKKVKNPLSSYTIYIYRVLKKVHPDLGISCKAMSVLNSFCGDILERTAKEANVLVEKEHKKTMTSKDIEVAFKFTLPGELSKFGLLDAEKARDRIV